MRNKSQLHVSSVHRDAGRSSTGSPTDGGEERGKDGEAGHGGLEMGSSESECVKSVCG